MGPVRHSPLTSVFFSPKLYQFPRRNLNSSENSARFLIAKLNSLSPYHLPKPNYQFLTTSIRSGQFPTGKTFATLLNRYVETSTGRCRIRCNSPRKCTRNCSMAAAKCLNVSIFVPCLFHTANYKHFVSQ